MSLDIGSFFNHALHIKAATLKGTPFIAKGQEERVAHQVNAVTAPLAHMAASMLPALAVNSLHVRPESLHHISEIHDPVGAAAFINDHLAAVLTPKP